MNRISTLLAKELIDIRHHPSIFLPAVLTGLLALVMPLIVAVGIPAMTGEPLTRASDVVQGGLDAEALEQAWIFQQFLLLLTLSPTAAAMSVAAWSIVGEKQARTLEPLLATPLTTFELLAAKAMSAMLPAVGLITVMFALYLGAIAWFARPGVAATLLTPIPLAVSFVLAPLSALAALQLWRAARNAAVIFAVAGIAAFVMVYALPWLFPLVHASSEPPSFFEAYAYETALVLVVLIVAPLTWLAQRSLRRAT